MDRTLKLVTTLGVAVLLAACGSDAATSVDAPVPSSEMQGFLKEAGATAKGFGRDHLGHYLDLDGRVLRREGLQIPRGISVTVASDHTSFCIRATNHGAASNDPWRVATVSTDGRPSSSDSCPTSAY